MTRNQLPNIPEPGPSPAPDGILSVTWTYDGTCEACGAPATQHGWVMRPNYDKDPPCADIIVERSGWCGELSCIRERQRWATVLDRESAWDGHRD